MPWRSRSLRTKIGTGDYFDPWFGNTAHEYFHFYADGSQTTFSEDHDWPHGAGTGADIGGPFFTDKNWTEPGLVTLNIKAGGSFLEGFRPNYNGPGTLGMLGFGQTTMLQGGTFEPTPSSELRTMAGPVIKNMSPTESEAGISQMLGELKREGLPRLIGAETIESRARDFRSYGSEYLNYQFGWKPFVNDLYDLGHAVKDSKRILDQFHRDSGRLIRRRADLPAYTETYDTDEGGFYASPLNGSLWGVINRPTRSFTTIQKKRWVVAAYQYYLDPGTTILGKFNRFNQEADKLLGVSLSPEIVWELAPWSWAVDWFSNTGNTISQLSDYINFGPALKYAYVMETVTSKRSYIGTGFVDASGQKHDLSYTYHRVTKTREPASPFVFANSSGELSGAQLAILAALGVSKVP